MLTPPLKAGSFFGWGYSLHWLDPNQRLALERQLFQLSYSIRFPPKTYFLAHGGADLAAGAPADGPIGLNGATAAGVTPPKAR